MARKVTLNPRQQRFVAEYLIDLNASQAYIRAGYSGTSADTNSWELMQRPQVRAAIEAGRKRLMDRLEINAERVLAGYARVAFANIRDYLEILEDGSARVDLSRTDPAVLGAIAEVTVHDYESRKAGTGRARSVRLKLASRLHALDALARHLGLFDREKEGTCCTRAIWRKICAPRASGPTTGTITCDGCKLRNEDRRDRLPRLRLFLLPAKAGRRCPKGG